MFYKTEKSIHVSLENTTTKDTCVLVYTPLDIDIVDRWMRLVQTSIDQNLNISSDYRKILSKKEIIENLEDFKENIKQINQLHTRELPMLSTIADLIRDESILNDLHQEFEIFGDLLTMKEADLNGELYERMLALNTQIHNFEAIVRKWDDLIHLHCRGMVDFLPTGLYSDLTPEDYLLFSSNLNLGWMYLGYNTLGKNWLSVIDDNDIDVVRRGAVRPQAKFAAEFFMDFGEDPKIPFSNQIKLYQWLTKHNLHKNYTSPPALNEVALGFIPLARLREWQINGDEVFKARNIRTRAEKLQWNIDVWSKYDTITNIEITNNS
jgi:hypothetical protein